MTKLQTPFLNTNEKKAMEEGLKFFESMLTDRIATYGGKHIFLQKLNKWVKKTLKNKTNWSNTFTLIISCYIGFRKFRRGNGWWQCRSGVGNFSSRQARFTEKKFFAGQIKRKNSFSGHSFFEKFYFKIKKIYSKTNV